MAHPANVSIKHISEYVDELEDKSCIIPSDNALMFCYFNSLHYFHKYLQAYSGKIESTVDLKCMLIWSFNLHPISASGACLIIIGPENNDGGRHCEPEPLYLQIQESKEWRIEAKFRWLKL